MWFPSSSSSSSPSSSPRSGASTPVPPYGLYRDELKDLVAIGHTDIMSVPPTFPSLADELKADGEVPVISLPGLILMKLDAFRG